jgi:hypothetical protein
MMRSRQSNELECGAVRRDGVCGSEEVRKH